jgi:C4-type Zn-finger protein
MTRSVIVVTKVHPVAVEAVHRGDSVMAVPSLRLLLSSPCCSNSAELMAAEVVTNVQGLLSQVVKVVEVAEAGLETEQKMKAAAEAVVVVVEPNKASTPMWVEVAAEGAERRRACSMVVDEAEEARRRVYSKVQGAVEEERTKVCSTTGAVVVGELMAEPGSHCLVEVAEQRVVQGLMMSAKEAEAVPRMRVSEVLLCCSLSLMTEVVVVASQLLDWQWTKALAQDVVAAS